jgi:hypothetical protein
VTVNLAAPGTRMVDRWNQLDLSVQKTFKVGRVEYQGMFSVVQRHERELDIEPEHRLRPRLGQPLEILAGRAPRLAVQMTFSLMNGCSEWFVLRAPVVTRRLPLESSF